MIEIVLAGIVLIAAVILIVVVFYNKYQFAIIKMEEAENNIDILLQKKLDLMKSCRPIIKKSLKEDDFMIELDALVGNQLNHFELNDALRENYNMLFKTLDENEKLYKNKKLVSIIENVNNNELELVAAIKFYNDNVVIYNHLIKTFPSNIIKLIFGYREKKFYKNEKREIFEILKNK